MLSDDDIVMRTDSAKAYCFKVTGCPTRRWSTKKIGGRWIHPTRNRKVLYAGAQTIAGPWQKVREETKRRTGGRPH
eukprot:6455951-Amphidinium_carterae.2